MVGNAGLDNSGIVHERDEGRVVVDTARLLITAGDDDVRGGQLEKNGR